MTSARGMGRGAVPLLALAGGAEWWAGSAPVLALVASYVALLLLVRRALPLRIAVSAAFVALLGCYLVLLVIVPVVVDGPMRPGVALGILLAPCLALAAELRPGGRRPGTTKIPWSSIAAALVGSVVLVGSVLLASRNGPYGAIAWTTSGDARNHLLDAREILAAGGLHGSWLTGLPMLQEAVMALLLNTHGRGTLAPGALLRHDLHAYAMTSTALVVLWTLSTTALLLGFGRLRGRSAPLVVLVASLLPLTGLALGVALRDGFVPILLLQPLLLCTLAVLVWLTMTKETGTPVTVAIGATAAALPLAATTWTPFFAILAGACAVPWLVGLRSGRQRAVRLALMAFGVLAGSAVCLAVISNTDGFLTLTGSIAAPSPARAALLPALVLAIAVGRWAGRRRLAFAPYLAATVVAAGIVVFAVAVQPPGLAWNYYPSKVAWIWAAVSLPLLLVPFAHPRRLSSGVGRAAGAGVVLLGGLALSPVVSPVLPMAVAWTQTGLTPQGASIGTWSQPDTDALATAVRLGDGRRSYVVYAVDPEQDRLTNFWLATLDPPSEDYFGGTFVRWAYGETGTPVDICNLLALQPDRIVATADPAVKAELSTRCGADVKVRLLAASG